MNKKELTYSEESFDIFKRLLISLLITIAFLIVEFLFIIFMKFSEEFVILATEYNIFNIIYCLLRIVGTVFVIGFNGICIFMVGRIYGHILGTIWCEYGNHA